MMRTTRINTAITEAARGWTDRLADQWNRGVDYHTITGTATTRAPKVDVEVRTYKGHRALEKDAARRLTTGWTIAGQTAVRKRGIFLRHPDRVTVTWTRTT